MVSLWRMGSQPDTRTVETSFYSIFKCHCENKLEFSHPLAPWFPHPRIQPPQVKQNASVLSGCKPFLLLFLQQYGRLFLFALSSVV